MVGLFAVLDTGVTQHPELGRACIDHFERTGERVGVSWTALYEQTKNSNWRYGTEKLLGTLSECPECVAGIPGAFALAREELSSGVTTVSVDRDSAHMQALLRLVRSGKAAASAVFDVVEQGMGTLPPYSAFLSKNASEMLRLNELLEHLDKVVGAEKLMEAKRQLEKRGGPRTAFHDLLAHAISLDGQKASLIRFGVPASRVDHLAAVPSICLVAPVAFQIGSISWALLGGIQDAKPERMANDTLDVDFLVTGLWARRLITDDRRARERFDDIKAVGAAFWPSHRPWFEAAEAITSMEALARLTAAPTL